MIKIAVTVTDEQGNCLSLESSYEGTLVGKNLDSIEQFVFQAKSDLGKEMEQAMLKQNQSEFTKKKRLSKKRD